MAHKLLRHLRNAAHGKITNEKRKKILSDYNENKRQTMRGKTPFQKNGIYWVRHLYYG